VWFVCFDSARDIDLAKSRVGEIQRGKVVAALRAKLVNQPKLRSCLKVVRVHHHPFSFHAPAVGLGRMFEKLGIREEDFLRMDDGEAFVQWWGDRGVLVLYTVTSMRRITPMPLLTLPKRR